MFSERLIFPLALLALVALPSCNFHFREAPEPDQPLQLGDSEAGCLTGSFDKISNYLSGTASTQEITSVWNCLSRSLQLFSERTRGAKAGTYTPNELRGFLEKYFLEDFRISDGLLREAMELKCTLLGGSPEVVTTEELERTLQLVQVLSEESIHLKNFIPLSLKWAESKDARTVDDAVSALESAAQAIGRPLQRTGYPYFFARFNALRKEVEAILGRSTSSTVFKGFRDRMPLVRAMKSILVSPKGDRIDGNEWVNFLTTSARWYGITVRFWHLYKNYPQWTSGEGQARLVAVLIDALTLLDEAAARHPGEVIPFHEIEALVDGLYDDELPFAENAAGEISRLRSALKGFVKPLIRRVLGGSTPGREGRDAQGITREGLKRLIVLIEQWSEGQRYLEALFEHATREYGNELGLGFTAEELLAFSLEDVLHPSEINPITRKAAAALQDAIPRSPAFFLPADSYVSIGVPQLRRRSFHDLSIMNLSYLGARIMIEGYAEPARAKTEKSILLSEFHEVLAETLDMALVIRFLDPNRDNQKMFTTRFMEGSLFTFASDGDDYLDLHETAQLFPMLFSAYLMANNIHNDAKERPCRITGPDPFGKPTFKASCYYDNYFENLDRYWARLPGMLRYYRNLSSWGKSEFREHLIRAARLPGSPKEFINSNDSIGFAGVAQYVEALFSRFDKNASGFIDATEAQPMFPVFKDALRKVVEAKGLTKMVPEKDLEALFTYILAHSGPPSKVTDLPRWWWWKSKSKNRWKFKADRMTVIKIFGELIQG